MPRYYIAQRGRSILVTGAAIASLIAGGVIACNPGNALKVPTPDTVNPSATNTIGGLAALHGGVLSAFQTAFLGGADEGNGGHEGFINLTGLFSDEMEDMETFPTRILVDGRVAASSNATLNAYFIDMTSARAIADKADAAYDTFAADSLGHAIVLDLGGYTYVMFAEAYCEGVPVSTLNVNGTITYGQPLTRNQLLAIALQRFDSAILVANSNGDTIGAQNSRDLARIGAARALLDSNDDADAAAMVAAVSPSYIYQVHTSTNSALENNGIWNYTFNEQGFSVSDIEGTNGLPFVSANDPRVPSVAPPGLTGTSGVGPFIVQLLYQTQASPVTLASGIEAQLIIAEHQQRTGGPWLATLNALRATEPGLPPLVDAGSAAGDVSLLFSERAFWMYLTGHRVGDLRRLIRQYGRNVNAVFPIGTDVNGAPYGPDVNFDISEFEANNPNFHGCLNRSA
jgi:starch-binding outer membrane protein, SusD/RagB family